MKLRISYSVSLIEWSPQDNERDVHTIVILFAIQAAYADVMADPERM